jgi:crotonobetainyl-CoA:carnitine CoA-transferase CaiB-like acyl-CoA transferase
MFAEVVDPDAGPFETLSAPFTLSGSEVAVRGPAPRIGQHTAEVLASLGIEPARIAALGAGGVVGGPLPPA